MILQLATMNNCQKPSNLEVEKQAKFWLDSAKDNFETAEAMLSSKRYNFAMFMCQQTIEAVLKCAFIKLKSERPEYIHKLPRLLSVLGLDAPLWLEKIILRVDAHYIKARYFEDRFDSSIYNRENAAQSRRANLVQCTKANRRGSYDARCFYGL